MPYKIRKVRNQDLYVVYNSATKKRMSYEPLTKDIAMKQLKALYLKEGIDYQEKKFMSNKMRYPKGSQQARDAMAKARQNKKNFTGSLPSVPESSVLS